MASKSRYCRHPLTRQLWQGAFAALLRADRITLFGYSRPQTDIVMAGILKQALRDQMATVEIVNPATDGICKRVEMLGGPTEPSERLHVFREERCVEEYARILCARASGEVARKSRT